MSTGGPSMSTGGPSMLTGAPPTSSSSCVTRGSPAARSIRGTSAFSKDCAATDPPVKPEDDDGACPEDDDDACPEDDDDAWPRNSDDAWPEVDDEGWPGAKMRSAGCGAGGTASRPSARGTATVVKYPASMNNGTMWTTRAVRPARASPADGAPLRKPTATSANIPRARSASAWRWAMRPAPGRLADPCPISSSASSRSTAWSPV